MLSLSCFMHRGAAAATPEFVHSRGSRAMPRRTTSHPRHVQLVPRSAPSSRCPCTSSPMSSAVPRCVSDHRRVADAAAPPVYGRCRRIGIVDRRRGPSSLGLTEGVKGNVVKVGIVYGSLPSFRSCYGGKILRVVITHYKAKSL